MVFGELDGYENKGETQMAGGMHMEDDGYVMTDLSFPAPIFYLVID